MRLEGGAPDGEGAAHETGAAGAASAVISADEEGASALGGWWLGAVKVRPVGRKPTWYRVGFGPTQRVEPPCSVTVTVKVKVKVKVAHLASRASMLRLRLR